MVAIVNRELCTGCGQCVNICPMEAILLDDEKIAVVDSNSCIDSGNCVDICPVEAISIE
jgi:Fe-S-cluster-containing hydrogenase component 2